jgi:glycosyltransferase involved in cell wall biosynthesis
VSTQQDRLRVLVVAEDCNPEWPSLPVVGYKAVKALAEVVDVTLATQVRNRPAIEAAGGCGQAQVVYLDNEYIAAPLHRIASVLRGGSSLNWGVNAAFGYPAYLFFEWEVWKQFRYALRAREYDVVHRLTPMTPTQSSPLAKWSPVPFILGPLNGGLQWPTAFRDAAKREREWLHRLRSAYRWLPYHRAMLRDADAILASFAHTIKGLPKEVHEKVIDFPEIGVDPDVFQARSTSTNGGRVQFVFVGRLVPVKAIDVLLEAMAASEVLRRQRLVIVGDGPERPRLEALAAERGLGAAVTFAGWKTQQEVGELLRESDVFAFPSIKELGAGVVVEAMATGLPCVVVDYGAPGRLVGEGGIAVPLESRDQMVTDFRAAMEALVGDPARRAVMGETAKARAAALFPWDAKARKTVEVYEWVLGRGEKPSFYPEATWE